MARVRSPQQRRLIFCVITLSFISFLYFSYRYLIKIEITKYSSPRPPQPRLLCDLSSVTQSSKQCILEYIQENRPSFGRSLSRAIDLCTKIFTGRLTIAHLHNLDDVKEAAKPLHDRQQCTVITIGIGNDIEAEKQLKMRVPSCKFYGADPILETGKIYQEIGYYMHAAISDTDGIINASVKINGTYFNDQSVKSISLINLINIINVSIIDYMFMDGEGVEYKLLPYIIHNEKFDIDRKSIKICQIAVEAHGYLTQYGMTPEKFDLMIEDLLQNSSFVPLWPRYGRHMHFFLINTNDQYCVDKYFDVVCSDVVEDEWKNQRKKTKANVG